MSLEQWSDVFNHAVDTGCAQLKADQLLSCYFSAEDSTFVRFNKSKVRQVTQVEQASCKMELFWQHRKVTQRFNLCRDLAQNKDIIDQVMRALNTSIQQLPISPYYIEPRFYDTSETHNAGLLPDLEEILALITTAAQEVDLAGLLTMGPNYRGQANSLGQRHWFVNKTFIFDFSLYSAKERAIKGLYGGAQFESAKLIEKIQEAQAELRIMDRDKIILPPGAYRCYLAPQATKDLVDMLGWGALSASAYHQGTCALSALIDQEKTLSPLLSVSEDYRLGLTPRFNQQGQLPPQTLGLIQQGHLQNVFINDVTAQEYAMESNQADVNEAPKSLVMQTGSLAKSAILSRLDTGIYISNLHYLNWSDQTNARVTGMTRFGCLWVERGVIKGPIKDLRFDDTLYNLLGEQLEQLTDFTEVIPETGSYGERDMGGAEVAGILIKKLQFTL